MYDKSALYAFSYGLYLLTTKRDGVDNGCIVDAVMQSASDPAHITISCMTENLTREMISESGVFNLSVLTKDTPQEFFQQFGMQSGRDVDKFADATDMARSDNGLYYYTAANAYVTCEVVATLDLGDHIQFTAKIIDAVVLSQDESITYAFYRKRMKRDKAKAKPASEPVVEQAASADDAPAAEGAKKTTKFVCTLCGYVVEIEGDELPADFTCPLCGMGPEFFEKVED